MEKMMIFLLTALCLIGHTTVTWAAENDGAVIADSITVYQARKELSQLSNSLTSQETSHTQKAKAFLKFRDANKKIIVAAGPSSVAAAQEFLLADEHEKALECYQWTYERYQNIVDKPEYKKFHASTVYHKTTFGIAQCFYLSGDLGKAREYYQILIDRNAETGIYVKLKRDDHEQYFIPYFKPIAEETLCNHCEINPTNHAFLYPTNESYKIFRKGSARRVAEFMLKLIDGELEGGQK